MCSFSLTRGCAGTKCSRSLATTTTTTTTAAAEDDDAVIYHGFSSQLM